MEYTESTEEKTPPHHPENQAVSHVYRVLSVIRGSNHYFRGTACIRRTSLPASMPASRRAFSAI